MGAKAAHRRGVLDLEAQFAFFRSQHRHPVNAAAHALLTGPSSSPTFSSSTSCRRCRRSLAAHLGFAASWRLVLATQLFCWTWQFLGHGLFEKKGPTVSELPEVFLMEPFLIFLQILNKLFGYEPYPGFCKNVDKKMEADLRESRELEQRKTS
ncbi:hypothetical protein SETIT_6G158300v2 [Setaria italica]|uniref:Uncharacterized protein n=1 Tax=Setaria italica TaxID=4555 RepID=K3YMZ2_SETIT|nr:hypothetical protein SETIT_6G158300v2 [Setaria italica]